MPPPFVRSPVVLVQGTWGYTDKWWFSDGAFASMLAGGGFDLLAPEDPFVWSTEVDGLRQSDNRDWASAGKALCWYVNAKYPPLRPGVWLPVSIIAHSHGGNVLAEAAWAGLVIDRAITIATPVRVDMERSGKYDALRRQSKRWAHLYTNESFFGGWQRRGEFKLWDSTAMWRGLFPKRTMDSATENISVPGRTHHDLLDAKLWRSLRSRAFYGG